jgi:predicted permease
MGMLWQDVWYGFRMLRKNPGFTFVAVLTLALGIGANTAIFTLMEALLLKSLPVQDPQRLAFAFVRYPSSDRNASFSYPLYQQWRDENRSFSGLFTSTGISRYRMMVEGTESVGPERVGTEKVSGNFFDVLGVPAVLGRTLTPDDDRLGNPQPVAVLSYGFWQRRFGLDPAVVGKTILLEDTAFTIVGVTPRGFSGFEVGGRPDLWLPIQAGPLVEGAHWAELLTSADSQWLHIAGRLKPGVSAERARAELEVSYRRLVEAKAARDIPEKERAWFLKQRLELETGGAGYSRLRWEFRRPLLILMAIVGLVLLVACANLAGLLLARGAARGRELGVRAALGAGRFILIRQLAVESLLLALAGGAAGLVVAQWGAQLLAHYAVRNYGSGVQLDLSPDLRVLTFTFVLSALAGVLFGLLPAWRSSRLDLTTTLKNQTGLAGGESGQFWNKVLVVSQIAVTCCLLVGAGLFVRTVQKLKSLDLGLNRENLLSFELDLGKGYDVSRHGDFYWQVVQRVESLPGVRSACCSNIQSLGGSESGYGPYKVVPAGRDLSEGLDVRGTGVTRDYFATLGIPLVRGRAFGPQDEPVDPTSQMSPTSRAAIIDEIIARKLFGDEDPVGQFLRADDSGSTLEVIGVAKDVMHQSLRGGPRPSVYSIPPPAYRRALGYFHARTVGNPLAVAGAIRQAVRELDPKVEVTELRTMTGLVNDQMFRERSLSRLVGFFSLLALVLACLGLYGTLSCSVVRRTREIGVRMALGAQRQMVLSLVLRQGLKLVLIGIGIGLSAALAMTRLVSSLLYGITPTDPLTFVGVSLLLIAVSLLACGLPARRAAGIDPMTALRCE